MRAVARKSTSKVTKPGSLTSVAPRGEDSNLNSNVTSEHKGRFYDLFNEKYHHAEFEPHQCSTKCVEDFPYANGDYKSKFCLGQIYVTCRLV